MEIRGSRQKLGKEAGYLRNYGVSNEESFLNLKISSTMDPPLIDVGIEKLEEVKKNQEDPLYHCDLFDAEITHKIAQALLPGLASACVDNTTGNLFKSSGSVAVDIRKEMVDYLTQRSETFVAESVVLEGGAEEEVSEHPYDIISDFIDDFARSKRNFFSQVSSWALSERREDLVDDFVQELEINGFWLIGRREAIAQTLLRNVDFKNSFHCNMKFNSEEGLAEHVPQCSFRTVSCPNEGCNTLFTAGHVEVHDASCPFKILKCEQKCPDTIMRRNMDKHCITVCPMKLVNCSFYPVGCQSTFPRCTVEQHNSEHLHFHILYILQGIYKEVPIKDLKQRAEKLEKSSSPGRLAKARNVQYLTHMVKDIDSKLGALEVSSNESEEMPLEKKEKNTESPTKTEELPSKGEELVEFPTIGTSMESSTKQEISIELPAENNELSDPPGKSDCLDLLAKKEELMESPSKKTNMKLSSKKEDLTELSAERNELSDTLGKSEEQLESMAKEELMEPSTQNRSIESPRKSDLTELSAERNEPSDTLGKSEEQLESMAKEEELMEPYTQNRSIESPRKSDLTELSAERNELSDTLGKSEEQLESMAKELMEPPTQNRSIESPKKSEDLLDSPSKKEEHTESHRTREDERADFLVKEN